MKKEKIKKIFLAGIIQGSKKGRVLHNQNYRGNLKSILKRYFPKAKIVDPVEVHPSSAYYQFQKGKRVFHQSIEDCCNSDLMIAYVPEASMGTAIEMWECYKRRIPVWIISPLKENWAVKFLSSKIFKDFCDLETYVKNSFKK